MHDQDSELATRNLPLGTRNSQLVPRDSQGSTQLTPLDEGIALTPTPHPAGLTRAGRALGIARATRARRCAYIRPSGVRCGSPALRGNHLCYYHDRYQPKPGYRNLPPLEDPHSLQCAIQEIIEDLFAGLVDYKRAALALYGLQTAAANFKQMRLAARASRLEEQEAARSDAAEICCAQPFAASNDQRPTASDPPPPAPSRSDAAEICCAQPFAASQDQRPTASDPPPPAASRSDAAATARRFSAGCAAPGIRRAVGTAPPADDPWPTTQITQLPANAVESPRPPQHVKVGLTHAERTEMRNWFPKPIIRAASDSSPRGAGAAAPAPHLPSAGGATCDSPARQGWVSSHNRSEARRADSPPANRRVAQAFRPAMSALPTQSASTAAVPQRLKPKSLEVSPDAGLKACSTQSAGADARVTRATADSSLRSG